MKNKTNLMLVITFFAMALCCLAQETNGVPAGDEGGGTLNIPEAWRFAIVPLTVLLVSGLKRVIPLIPPQLWPWITPVLGVLLDYAGSKFGAWTGSLEAGAILGGLAVWLHQLGTQTKALASKPPESSSNTP